jgi:predicted ester cyclase
MRKILIATSSALLCFFSSCSDKGASTTANDDTEKINAKSKAVYKAIETGDASGLDSIMDNNIVDHDMGGKKGLDSVKAMISDIHNHFTDLKFDVISQAYNGDYHFTLITVSGTPKDNFMGMEPGKAISMKSIDVVKIKDGKATEHWGFTDNADMMKMQEAMMGPNKMDTTKAKK